MRKWVASAAHRSAIELLANERTKRGLSLREVTARLGKAHHTYLHKIEIGERSLDLIEFIAIARAIGADEQELFKRLLEELPEKLDV